MTSIPPSTRAGHPSTRTPRGKQQAAQRVRAATITRRIATQKEREKVQQIAKIRDKKLRKAREYNEMKYRPISWSEEMKEGARKDKNNPLAGQYLWMDDPTAPGSAAWVEKGINKVLKIDPSKKFEWEKWKTRGLPEKVGELGWEFVKGAANTVPAVMRVVSSGAYSASKLASAPPKRIAPTLSEATGKMVTTGIKEALENPAEFAGGMVGVTGIAGGIAKAAKGGVKGVGKLSGKKSPMVIEEKGGIGKRPSEKKKDMKFERSDNRKKREEERRKQEERKKREEQRKKREEERKKREKEQRKKREEKRKKRGEKRKKREAKGKKPKKVKKPHQRIRKIVRRAKLPHPHGGTPTRSRKTAGRASQKSYRRKEVVNNLPWL